MSPVMFIAFNNVSKKRAEAVQGNEQTKMVKVLTSIRVRQTDGPGE